jgi:hypothetical protein
LGDGDGLADAEADGEGATEAEVPDDGTADDGGTDAASDAEGAPEDLDEPLLPPKKVVASRTPRRTAKMNARIRTSRCVFVMRPW